MIPQEIKTVLKQLEANGYEAYIVGGFVRDALLYRRTNDIDIATNALPMELIRIFGPSKKKIEYGSYHMKIENYNIDITTYREETYEEGKLINIKYSNNMLEDAKRRDFTINAIYLNGRENMIDLFHGKEDIENKVIKMIGNSSIRLKEDPIRILRAVRFASIYHFKLDKSLITAIQKNKKELAFISDYKIRKELDGILLANGFTLLKNLKLLKELGILNDKIVYVEDISGLWAQVKTNRNYISEKSLQINQKRINNLIKCGTINMLDLYRYGYYECRVVAQIIHFPLKKLAKMERKLVIHNPQEIALNNESIKSISQLKGEELGTLIQKIEEQIVLYQLKNEKESIVTYIKERG